MRLGKLARLNKVNPNIIVDGIPLPYGYFAGLNTVRESINDIAIGVGAARDFADSGNMKNTAVLTKQFDNDWAEGDDAGGFPETALTQLVDTWYHLFIIGKTDGSAVDGGFDTALTASNLLGDAAVSSAGYTTYRRVGSVRTDGATATTVLDYTQLGNHFIWAASIGDEATTFTLGSRQTVTLTGVPPDVSVLAEMNYQFSDGSSFNINVSQLSANDEAPTLADAAPNATLIKIGADTVGRLIVRTDTSAGFGVHATGTGSLDNVNFSALGWIDDLRTVV